VRAGKASWWRGFGAGLGLSAALMLVGCDTAPPAPAPSPALRPEIVPQSPESLALAAHFARVQSSLLTNGLLRSDGGGPDVPFNARTLTRNFLRIALYQEYSEAGGRLVATQAPSYLHRWEKPLRYEVTFGASVPRAQRLRDDSTITRYTKRLARITGLSMTRTRAEPNFHIFIVNEDERRALAPRLRALHPGISQAALDTAVNMERDTYCLAFGAESATRGTYERAIIIIRGEHPDLLRASCIHEEIAQGLGLANDHPKARPSIFNDDEEFGLLTTHDEQLLKILYDPRLTPGMIEAQARPIVEEIAGELMGGDV
jgi:hypothetical protein